MVALSSKASPAVAHALSGNSRIRHSVLPYCGGNERRRSIVRSNPSSRKGSTELAGEQGFLLDEATNRHGSVVYGQNFVIHRQTFGGPGLVPSPGAKLQPYVPADSSSGGNLSLALAYMQQQTGLVPFGSRGVSLAEGALVIDTVAEDLSDVDCSLSSSATTSCVGMVLYQDPNTANDSLIAREGEDRQVVENVSSNPRRTKKVQFTCKLCHTTTISPVNPHAWQDGSVFARCGGCNVVHKLRDNLELFHEVSGPVFGAQMPRVRVPRGLPQNPGVGLDQPIGGFKMLDDDLAL